MTTGHVGQFAAVALASVGVTATLCERVPVDTPTPQFEMSIHPEPDYWLKAIDGSAYAHIFGLAVSPDGRTVAAGSTDGAVRIWDVASGRLLRTISDHTKQVLSVAYALDGRSIAAGQKGGEIRLREFASGRVLKTIQAAAPGPGVARVADLTYSPDARWLAVSLGRDSTEGGTIRGEVVLLDVKEGARLRVLSPERSHFRGTVRFTPDGKAVAFAAGKRVVLIDPETGREVGAFDPPEGRSVAAVVTISPNSEFVAAQVMWSSQGGGGPPDRQEVLVWDLATRRRLATLAGHQAQITSLSFLPDGVTLVSSSWDGTVRFWDVKKGEERLVIPARPGPPKSRVKLSDDGMIKVIAASLSADGAVLAAAYDDGVVRVWDTQTLLAARK